MFHVPQLLLIKLPKLISAFANNQCRPRTPVFKQIDYVEDCSTQEDKYQVILHSSKDLARHPMCSHQIVPQLEVFSVAFRTTGKLPVCEVPGLFHIKA